MDHSYTTREDIRNIVPVNIKLMLERRHKSQFTMTNINNYESKMTDGKHTYYIVVLDISLPQTPKINDFFEFKKYNKGDKKYIITVRSTISHRVLYHFASKLPNIQVFDETLFMKDILQLPIIPEHILLNDKEIAEFKISFTDNLNQLPVILTTDFMCRYYNAKVGDIFKIIRKGEGTKITFRVVK